MEVTKQEKAYHDQLRELGCIVCRMEARGGVAPEIHHPRHGTGLALKAPHMKAIGLCPAHHRGTKHPEVLSIHLSPSAFVKQYGSEDFLWSVTQELLNEIEPEGF